MSTCQRYFATIARTLTGMSALYKKIKITNQIIRTFSVVPEVRIPPDLLIFTVVSVGSRGSAAGREPGTRPPIVLHRGSADPRPRCSSKPARKLQFFLSDRDPRPPNLAGIGRHRPDPPGLGVTNMRASASAVRSSIPGFPVRIAEFRISISRMPSMPTGLRVGGRSGQAVRQRQGPPCQRDSWRLEYFWVALVHRIFVLGLQPSMADEL